jgi:hypothetical protein
MPNDKLTPSEVAMLFALMAEAREISNVELGERYGLSIDGKKPGSARRKLNDMKLVESTTQGRRLYHQLTDAGWARCKEELAAPLPDKAGAVAGGFYALLQGLHRYLERSELSLADVFRPAGDTSPVVKRPAERPAATAPDLEAAIKSAYRTLAERRGGWVSLADLRPLLGEANGADVDAALIRLGGTVGVTLVPEDNQKTLTDADRAAAVRVGNRDHHYLAIEDA